MCFYLLILTCPYTLQCISIIRGHAKYMMVKFDEAIQDYDKALKLDSDFHIARSV